MGQRSNLRCSRLAGRRLYRSAGGVLIRAAGLLGRRIRLRRGIGGSGKVCGGLIRRGGSGLARRWRILRRLQKFLRQLLTRTTVHLLGCSLRALGAGKIEVVGRTPLVVMMLALQEAAARV